MTARERIGAALKAYRGDRLAKDIAAAAGIHRNTLLRIESGRSIPSEGRLAAVIAALGAWDVPELMSIAAETVPRHKRYAPATGVRLWLRTGEPPLSEVAVLIRAMRGRADAVLDAALPCATKDADGTKTEPAPNGWRRIGRGES